ncbi:acylphosphatase [Sunxiuqinia elliptica]|uniref:acylphosphatase n=1 Tax=Sunxiuqinia elliptica TaxID=655355 RepID=UPI0010CFE000|nr:acylphosphatase [Sunxiuqinia elliptica]TDO64423.1 acylphosphatase [Sunxiuqinia elliptica]
MNPRSARHIIVSGRVQGVGFRYFVTTKARECQLTGWVRNLPNGKVEIEVQGLSREIDCFIDYLKLGNGFSRTDQLHLSQLEPNRNYTDFEIHY